MLSLGFATPIDASPHLVTTATEYVGPVEFGAGGIGSISGIVDESKAGMGMIGWSNGEDDYDPSPGPVVRFSQGTITTSEVPINLAIQGEGFFVVEGLSGQRLYTRDGRFRFGSRQALTTITGEPLLGFGVDSHFQVQTARLAPIRIPFGSSQVAQPTENVYLKGSISSDAATEFQVFGTLGIAVPVRVSVAVEQRGDTFTAWRWSAESCESEPALELGSGRLAFGLDGRLIGVSDTVVSIPRNGVASASPLQFELDFGNVTVGDGQAVLTISHQDGAPPGRLTDIEISERGIIQGLYSTGTHRDLGQIPLAYFGSSPELRHVDAGLFAPRSENEVPSIRPPGGVGVGIVLAGATEEPNTEPKISFESSSSDLPGHGPSVSWQSGLQGDIRDGFGPTDIAICGGGYFVLEEESGQRLYTRNGSFHLDAENRLVDEAGRFVLGHGVDEDFQIQQTKLIPLEIPWERIVASETSTVVLQGTLSPDVDMGECISTTITVYDKRGAPTQVRLRAIFEGGTWLGVTYRWFVDPQPGDPQSENTDVDGSGELHFDEDGDLIRVSDPIITVSRPGTKPQQVRVDFSEVSGLAAAESSLELSHQDGAAPGTLASFDVDHDGIILGVFSNGVTRQLGQVQLAHFGFSPLLEEVAEGTFVATLASGIAKIDCPGKSGLGSLVAGAREELSSPSYAPTRLAIHGPGFLIVETPEGDRRFTRDGVFYTVDRGTGAERVTEDGARLLGYGVDDEFQLQTSEIVPIRTDLGSADIAKSTSNAHIGGTLSPDGELATQAQRIRTGMLGDAAYSAPLGSGDLTRAEAPSTITVTTAKVPAGTSFRAGDTYEYRLVWGDDRTLDNPIPTESCPSDSFTETIAADGDSIVMYGLPTHPPSEVYTHLRMYRRKVGADLASFNFVGQVAVGATTFTDGTSDAAANANMMLDESVISGNYSYHVTYVAADGTESRPGVLSGPINVSKGRIMLYDLPHADIAATQWRSRRIYRSLATDSNTFHLVGEIPNMDGGEIFVDRLPDSTISENVVIDLEGPRITDATRLVDVLGRDRAAYSPVFREGTLMFSGKKGGRLLEMRELDVTSSTTVRELIDFLVASMGIRLAEPGAEFPIPEDMGSGSNIPPGGLVTSDGRIVLTGNNGVGNAVDIGLSGMLLDTGTSIERVGLPWGMLQTAVGESGVTDFLVYDAQGSVLRVRLTAVLEERDSSFTTYRWFADSPDNRPESGTEIAVGTGRITFDGRGRLADVSNATVSIHLSSDSGATTLEFDLDFSAVIGLATDHSWLAANWQDGAKAGHLLAVYVCPKGRLYGDFSNGLTRELGQIPLAWFADPSALELTDGGGFAPTAQSGPPVIRNPGDPITRYIRPVAAESLGEDSVTVLHDLNLSASVLLNPVRAGNNATALVRSPRNHAFRSSPSLAMLFDDEHHHREKLFDAVHASPSDDRNIHVDPLDSHGCSRVAPFLMRASEVGKGPCQHTWAFDRALKAIDAPRREGRLKQLHAEIFSSIDKAAEAIEPWTAIGWKADSESLASQFQGLDGLGVMRNA